MSSKSNLYVYIKKFIALLINFSYIILSILTILYLNKLFEFGNTKVINEGTLHPEMVSYMDYGETPFFLIVFILLYFFYLISRVNIMKINTESILSKTYISFNLLLFCLLITALTHLGSFFVANTIYLLYSLILNIKIKDYVFKNYIYLISLSVSPMILLIIKNYNNSEIINVLVNSLIFPSLYIVLFNKIFKNFPKKISKC